MTPLNSILLNSSQNVIFIPDCYVEPNRDVNRLTLWKLLIQYISMQLNRVVDCLLLKVLKSLRPEPGPGTTAFSTFETSLDA